MAFKLIKKPVFFGLIAGIILLGLYFSILTLANSFSHAIEQFKQIWYWVLALIFGFGLQVGLYSYVREAIGRKQVKDSAVALAASGGVSTGSMVVCCLHHFADVLPLIGLAGLSLFLVQYQTFFLSLGLFSNLIGIAVILETVQKNNLSKSPFKKILIYDTGKIKKIIIAVSLVSLATILFFSGGFEKKIGFLLNQNDSQPVVSERTGSELTGQTDSRGGIDFEVKPVNFSLKKPVQFEIKIGTHSGELNFDLMKDSVLKDDKGNQYLPLEWQGPAIGGHHGFGILVFPVLKEGAGKINLTVQDFSNRSARVFDWDIQ